jgi:predicted anti-sigma-YlaC factor YlaD
MCEDVQVAMSARLDGEDPGVPVEAIDSHVAGCPTCTAWLGTADRIRAETRWSVGTAPDRTEAIMAAVAADAIVAAQVSRHRAAAEAHARRQVLRVGVGLAALLQLGLALPTLVGAFLAGPSGAHTGREMASFDVAVAVGFLLAAYRPARARAFVPVALVLAACLAITSGVDLVRGVTNLAHEFGHLVALVQAGLLWALGRNESTGASRVPRPRAAGTTR